ncbi:T-cell leukemia translocation-altered gene protein [Varanus komodoensis]|uniref:T-cell leukemia translocation-altered gene protein homolog n=1 Tax=Varanus komodoensis TaxID=61221 RepID=A0A8D2Q6G1_VARKO|nr:T-cell leukemia translocation-altered gene protein [Varanus komodoensis]
MAAAAAEEAVAAAAATATGSGEWEAPTRLLRTLTWLGQEFRSDWEAQDLRAALFQLLLLWLLVSLLGIQVAWRVYGSTVTGLYYRQGPGGQNGGTPDGSSHFSVWESSSDETMKTHRE